MPACVYRPDNRSFGRGKIVMIRERSAWQRTACGLLTVVAIGCGTPQDNDAPDSDSPKQQEKEQAEAASQQAAPSLRFLEIAASGSGCEMLPESNILINDQQSTFTAFTPDFIVRSGKDDASGFAAKSCNLNIKVEAPPGWRYGVSKIYYTGRATLPFGMSASVHVSYGFQGSVLRPRKFIFPIHVTEVGQEFKQVHEIAPDVVGLSSCGSEANLLLSTTLEVRQAPLAARRDWKEGWASLSTIDGETGAALSQRIAPNVRVELYWVKCPIACLATRPPRRIDSPELLPD
jgi:hypothetical protein